MRRLHRGWGLVAMALASCSESPTQSRKDIAISPAGATASLLCDKNWDGRDGSWQDGTEWIPIGVPTSADDVCIVDPGSYTIALDSVSFADSLYVGPGVTLTLTGRTIEVQTEIVIAPGAEVILTAFTTLLGDDLLNDGVLRVRGDAQVTVDDVFDNNGELDLDSNWASTASTFRNRGLLTVTRATITANTFEFLGGELQASDRLLVAPKFINLPLLFRWSGGTLGSRQQGNAPLWVQDMPMELANTSLLGAIDYAFTAEDTLRGSIGPGVDLAVMVDWQQPPTLLLRMEPLGSGGTARFVNEGQLTLIGVSSATDSIVLSVPGSFVNRGHLMLDPHDHHPLTLNLRADTLFNEGRISGAGAGSSSLHMSRVRQQVIWNVATMDSLAVESSGELRAVAGSRLDGTVTMRGGTLTGSGYVGRVQATGGVIAPGQATGIPVPGLAIGTLSFGTLELLDSVRLRMDVASTTLFDRVVTTGRADYGGQLEVQALGVFDPQAGRCGQVLPMFLHGNPGSGAPPAQFPPTTSIAAGPGRAWRVHHGRDTVFVAGYDPTTVVGTSRSRSLVEGGATAVDDVCLGVPVLGTDVDVTLTAARGQFSATPLMPVRFRRSDFALPRRVTYTAIDDAASEGPHVDTVYTLAKQGSVKLAPLLAATALSIDDNDPAVDLSIALVQADPPPAPNQGYEMTLRITNVGPGASTGSVLSVPNLTGATLQTSHGAVCTMNGANVECPLGALAAGAWLDVTLVLRSGALPGTYPHTIRIRGLDWDNVAANDRVLWDLVVQ